MSPEVRAAIEENKALIEAEDWEILCERLGETQALSTIGGISQALLDAGVDPLENNKKIPPHFFAALPITSYKVPEGIKVIGKGAFALCEDLREVILPRTIKIIQREAFLQARKLRTIIFQGTADEWRDIIKGSLWWTGTGDLIVKCLGGENID